MTSRAVAGTRQFFGVRRPRRRFVLAGLAGGLQHIRSARAAGKAGEYKAVAWPPRSERATCLLRPLGDDFERPLAIANGYCELDLVTGHFALVDEFHVVAAEVAGDAERNVIAHHLAFVDLARESG